MFGWMELMALSVTILTVAVLVLIAFLIVTLVRLQKAMDCVKEKVHELDPFFRIAEGLGTSIEGKIGSSKTEAKVSRAVEMGYDIAELAVMGLSIWQKIKERRR